MSKLYKQSVSFGDRLENAEAASAGYGLPAVTYTAARIIGVDDIGRLAIITNASGIACTLPKDSDDINIPIGARGRVMQGGAGLVTMTAGSGATVRKGNATLKLLQQYGIVTWEKIAANTYAVTGDLALS